MDDTTTIDSDGPPVVTTRARFAREAVWGLGLELITLVTTMTSFALLGRSLGPAGYGGYASLYAIAAPMMSLAVAGVVLSLLQHIVRDGEPLAATARSCLSLSLLLGSVLTVVSASIALIIIDSLTTVAIVSLLATELLTTPILLIAAGAVQATSGFAGAAQIRIVYSVVRIAVILTLFSLDSLTVASLGVWSLVSTSVMAVVAVVLVGRRYGFPFRPGPVRFAHVKTTVVYSVGISAFSFANDGDKVVLAADKQTVDTGLYAAAYRIVQLGSLPIGAVANASHAKFLAPSSVRGEHRRRALKYSVFTGAYGLVFAVAIVIAAPILPLFVGDSFEGSVEMVRWLAPLAIFRSIEIFPLNALMGLGRTGLRTGLIVANAAVSLVLYIVFIPRYGWKGAAVTTLAAELMMMIAVWVAVVVCQRRVDRTLHADVVGDEVVGDAVVGDAVDADSHGGSHG